MQNSAEEAESMEAKVMMVKSIVGSGVSESDVLRALSQSNNNVRAAISLFLYPSPSFPATPHFIAQKTTTSIGGARISTVQVNVSENAEEGGEVFEKKPFDGLDAVKQEPLGLEKVGRVLGGEGEGSVLQKCVMNVKVKEECDVGFTDGEPSGEARVPSGEKSLGCLSENAEEGGALSEKKPFDGMKVVKQEPLGLENGEVGRVSGGEGEGSALQKCDMNVKEECDVDFTDGEPSGEARFLSGEKSLGLVGSSDLSEKEGVKLSENAEGGAEVFGKKPFDGMKGVKQEPLGLESGEVGRVLGGEGEGSVLPKCDMNVKVKEECDVDFAEGEPSGEARVLSGEKSLGLVGSSDLSEKEEKTGFLKARVNEEPNVEREPKTVIGEVKEPITVQPLRARKLSDDEYKRIQRRVNYSKPGRDKDDRMASSSVAIEDGDFPEEPDWLLVGRTVVTGLSTTKGRKLEDNEIVHFAFPNGNARIKSNPCFMNSKAASNIIRFSTKRFGEIGRLPMEWAKCLVPLVNSTKVKVLGRCIAAPVNLQMMQEIMLYVSFYIHQSVFTDEGDRSSWKLEPSNIDTTTYPLLTLFKLLKVGPFQKAEFTPEELDSRKRSLKLDHDSDASVSPSMKRRKGCQQLQGHEKDEQAISESSLNKLVGAADMYNLEEMDPPETLTCDLRPYQKQALHWMSALEKGAGVEETEKTLHPCWAAYRICDERASSIYINIFSGEATTQFPATTQMARGGILADAMGLGKTVMTIALILSRKGKGIQQDQIMLDESTPRTTQAMRKPKGGTLIVCPMALLGQWKDELETHSVPESISIFIHYGGDKANDPKVMAEHDVVLTTYGVLTAAYKNDNINSIFHRVEWYRVVLDEAHTIKSSRTLCAQAAFALSSHCRWCLTGTPLQNNLEDLFSLVCFLHVEPWCNWAWWNKLIQKPYENGDLRGLKLVKVILRPLMLRRTKESKDKEGRPILVLPPTDIQIIECEPSEAEHDFYDALFKRSKVQFDQFVAQGKVLHNYANILELLLRLRQCCNHPFLVMSRGDTQKYADLNKLASRFLQSQPDSTSCQPGPSRAYVDEVVEGLRNGENAECPICLESADDPVLTPCAHRMCRECLLSSWRTPTAGLCPICRQVFKKSELITCPSGSHFRIDVERNWKESCKISELFECLEGIRQSGSGEKSIVFSQWTSFFDLLEIPLKSRKFGFLRFDGKLAQKQREKVLHEFAETKDKTVLLMSLKAGGVGLNLTAASNVFLMDPWWNPAVEEQAIMRIHRIGQKRTVHVRRFIVKDTVEERMRQVQARKQRMIAGALTDEEVRSARMEELKMLFR